MRLARDEGAGLHGRTLLYVCNQGIAERCILLKEGR